MYDDFLSLRHLKTSQIAFFFQPSMTSPTYSFPFHIWKFERNCTKIYSLDYIFRIWIWAQSDVVVEAWRELIPFAIGVGIIVSPRANFWVHSVFCLFSGVLFWIIIGQSLARASTARRYRTGWSVVLLLLPSRFVQGRFDRPLDGVGSRSRIFLTPAAVDNKIQKLVSAVRLFFFIPFKCANKPLQLAFLSICFSISFECQCQFVYSQKRKMRRFSEATVNKIWYLRWLYHVSCTLYTQGHE
jgi:hypothetical protein